MSLKDDTFHFVFEDGDGITPTELDVYNFLANPSTPLTAAFWRSKDHPRDEEGKFTEKLGASRTGSSAIDAVPFAGWKSDPKISINTKIGDGVSYSDVDLALSVYGSQRYKDINGQLRANKGNVKKLQGTPGASPTSLASTESLQQQVRSMDVGMDNSKLTDDVQVYRVVKDPTTVFGKSWDSDGDNTGLTWKDDGFTSTTPDVDYTDKYLGSGENVRMRILVPKGTPALYIEQQTDVGTPLRQIVLDRSSKFRVVADNGVVDGIRQLDVEVLS